MLILISCPCLARIFLINGRDSKHHKLSCGDTITSHHHGLLHPLETNNHCKNFEETFLKTNRTVWVITWWVEESWCLRLHKVRCCYDLHSWKWKPWVIQLKPGSGGSSSSSSSRQQAGAVFAHKLIWLPAWNWSSSSQDAAGRGGKQWTWSWGDGITHQQYEPSLRISCISWAKYFHFPIYPVFIW